MPQPNENQGVTSVVHHMQNIIYMQFSKFDLPYSPEADNVYRKVSLAVEEAALTSVYAHEGRQYHGLFDTEVIGNRIRCMPDEVDDGKFRFAVPITNLRTLTVTFGGPLTRLTFQQDLFTVRITSNAVNSTYINFTTPHEVSDGEEVIITDFTTLSPIPDAAAITEINREFGHVVSVVSNLILEINADLSTATLDAAGSLCQCFITTRRLFLPVRFVYIDNDSDSL